MPWISGEEKPDNGGFVSVLHGFVSMSAYRQVAKSVMTGFQSQSVYSRDDSIC